MNHAQAERAALCDLLDEVGPDAPTLCAGWRTADLAAHLVLREGRMLAAAGIGLRPLAGWTAAVQERIKREHTWPELVARLRHGPPKRSPYGLIPGLDALVNTVEFFVHHEDVRRARPGWEPRGPLGGLAEVLWRRLPTLARLTLRRAPVGVIFRRPDGARIGIKKAEPAVIVTGEPGELTLVAFGRQEHARVEYAGEADAVARLRALRVGI